MTETTNSARDQPTPKVDITPETIYNLIKLVEQNAPLLALLENHKPGPQDALKSEPKGASDMAKRHKQRVRIGTDEKGAAIYKWADGHTVEELNDNIVRLYIEHGLLRKFLDSHPNIVILDSKSKKDCPTFREYANQWYKKYKEQKLRTTSDSGYKSAFRLHLFPFFGDKRLDEITTDFIQEFLNAKADLSYSTVHSMLILFKQIMASAFEDRLIPFDPAVSKRITIPSTGKKTRDALTPEQVKAIIEAIPTLVDPDERRMLALFVFTGMRRGEVLGLRWEDIDFKKKLIHVERNITYAHNQPEIGSTKTNSGKRSIPLDSRLAECLKPHCSAGYVLGGAEPMTQMVFRRVFKHIKKNVELFGATPHIFRHTYITTLAKANVDLKTIQRISGHANITTTLNIYTHTREEEIQEAGDKIGELLGK